MMPMTCSPVPLTVAISPCPNDTAIFGSWILGQGEIVPDIRASFVWADVEELNLSAGAGLYDVIKVSAAQAVQLSNDYAILPCGGAFGLEHGPKLVARDSAPPRTIAVPGLHTTATALLQQALAYPAELIPMRYDLVVDAVQSGRVDAGLLIHESALLLERYGLYCLLDLGQWWFDKTKGLPLPLGCILGRHSLGPKTLLAVEQQIRFSLDHCQAKPQTVRPLVRALAQEVDEEVLDVHIQAYVNELSRDMGPRGRLAMEKLADFVPRGDSGRSCSLPTAHI